MNRFMFNLIFNKFYINLLIINLYGILILRIICLCQLDIKLIIAISSVVHIGIILIRILLIIKLRIFGRYYIIISHGFISSGLFYLVSKSGIFCCSIKIDLAGCRSKNSVARWKIESTLVNIESPERHNRERKNLERKREPREKERIERKRKKVACEE